MDWISFHHPDISWPVVRRRVGVELLECLELASLFLSRGGWGVLNRSCYPNKAAYQNAVSRLRKSGMLVKQSEHAATPQLVLTDVGRGTIPAYFSPERHWERKWNGIWYLMIYDVPEVDKKYRNVLRQFLRRMRMGNLQKSVWVVPRDIRPDFDDLSKAAGLDGFAYLFEAKTVLGLPSRRVVEEAWNFDELELLQSRYCDVAACNLEKLSSDLYSEEALVSLARMATQAYHSVFVKDPLLPAALLPINYMGKEVYRLHSELFGALSRQLDALSSK